MKRRVLIIAAIGLLMLAAGGLVYANRGALRDTVYTASKPQLPPAQSYRESVSSPLKGEMADASAKALAAEGQRGDVPTTGSATGPAAGSTPAVLVATAPALGTPPPASPLAEPQANVVIPPEINLAVPFTSQAPHANWDLPYQEACEEASLIMAAAYFNGETALAPDEADRRILDLVAWENRTFGFYEDTTAAETARMARERFGLKAEVKLLVSLDDLRAELAKGNVVVLPAAGRLLKNPYFSGSGPLYHMLVAKGYLQDGRIITNDPGTRRGADFIYDSATLLNAIHDWNGGDVENGTKVMIVLNK